MDRKIKVAVIFGGQSSEHEVSRFSAQSIINNIDRNKFDVDMIGITKDGRWLHYEGQSEKIGTGEWEAIAENSLKASLMSGDNSSIKDGNELSLGITAKSIISGSNSKSQLNNIDVVFPVLHGCNGEDGTIQGLFELAGVPYVGCGVLGSALGMDKAYAKVMFEKAGLPQGNYVLAYRKEIENNTEEVISKVENLLTYPCFVKPSNAGSSVGVSKAKNRDELKAALSNAAEYDRKVLVEEFINGREIECSVLGNDNPIASTLGEIIPCNEFYDYNAKYIDDKSATLIPANLPEETIKQVREYAVKAFKALDCAGLGRVDFFVEKETGKIYINEINTMPGFTKISMYPKLWEASGINYSELIEKLIYLAIERFEDNKRSIDRD